jgi:hypothetical protein
MRGLRLGLSMTGGASVFTPASLFSGGGLGAYYDPNDLTTMYQTGTRAAPGAAAAVGSPVGLLLDKSGNNNDATQTTAGMRPTLRQSGSLYYLEFSAASTQHLILPTALLTGWTSGTGIFAAKLNVDPSASGNASGAPLGDCGSDVSTDNYPWTSGLVYSGFLSSARKDALAADPGNMAAWHVGDFRSAANNWKASFNGTDYMTTATNTVGVGTAPMIARSGPAYLDGFIGRIIVKNSVLTGTDLSQARTWVGAGSGLVV